MTEKSISTAQAAGNGVEITLDIHYEPINLGKHSWFVNASFNGLGFVSIFSLLKMAKNLSFLSSK